MSAAPEPLCTRERQALLALARASVTHALGAGLAPNPSITDAALCAPGAAFVTLYVRQELRGCVGTVAWDDALHEVVGRVARAAAIDDRRFARIAAPELRDLCIEISRLTPLQAMSVAQIDVGVHGVVLECGAARALFLPKVATQHRWDLSMLLRQLCRKALLADDAWQQPDALIYTFTAEVFDDTDRGLS